VLPSRYQPTTALSLARIRFLIVLHPMTNEPRLRDRVQKWVNPTPARNLGRLRSPGNPGGIHLMIGRRPYAAFDNSAGDRQMLECTHAGDGPRLSRWMTGDATVAVTRNY
jgi:hypothetical protein